MAKKDDKGASPATGKGKGGGDKGDKPGKQAKGQPDGKKKGGKPGKGQADGKQKGAKKKAEKPVKPSAPPRLRVKYEQDIVPKLKEQFELANTLELPTLTKIVINMGVGRARENARALDVVTKHLGQLSGQRPIVTSARNSIAGFRLREGMNIGCKVTLRKDRMWFFLDKLIALAIPRIRDFRGVKPTSFDGRGNFTMGLSEQAVFPEIDIDRLQAGDIQGMNITINISGDSNEQSRWLLGQLGMPFERPQEAVTASG